MPLTIAALGTSQLYDTDLFLLRPQCWLNDALLSFYSEHLKVIHKQHTPRLAICHPGVALLCQVEEGEDLRSALFTLDFPALELLLLPISDSEDFSQASNTGSHWTLLRWRRGVGFSHQDSGDGGGKSSSSSSSRNLDIARMIASRLGPLLSPQGGGDGGGDFTVAPCPCTQQGNNYECGDRVLLHMEEASREYFGGGDTTPEIATLRPRILQLAKEHAVVGDAKAQEFLAKFSLSA